MRRVLFDHCVPRPLRQLLSDCQVSTARELGWEELNNGQLLGAAERAGFAVLITADKSLRYQQSLGARQIAIIEIPTNRLRELNKYASRISLLIQTAKAGGYEFA